MLAKSASAVARLGGALFMALPMVTVDVGAVGGATFKPHRAVYDIGLKRASGSSGVAGVSGRMIYELNGSRCEGFTQNMRFVTRLTSDQGAETVNDLRTSSWEDTDGDRLRFSSSQFQNDTLSDSSQGDAVRKSGSKGIAVDLSKPEAKVVPLPGDIYFPMQHAKALIDAARRGDRMFPADLYDGGEKGQKYFNTMAFISPASVDQGVAAAARSKLSGSQSWLITMAYFDPTKVKQDQVPEYELTFSFYETGVTSKLRIDYGEFAIGGTLKELTFLPESVCEPASP